MFHCICIVVGDTIVQKRGFGSPYLVYLRHIDVFVPRPKPGYPTSYIVVIGGIQ